MNDDVPENKTKRLSEIIEKQMSHSLLRNKEKLAKHLRSLLKESQKNLRSFIWKNYT